MSSFTSDLLTTGWEFKRSDDQSSEAWLPVAKVPTVVHLDLIDNNVYVSNFHFTNISINQL